MNARIAFSLLSFHVGAIDLKLDFDLLGDAEHEVAKATRGVRKAVKGISRLWVRNLVT
jgi:peroxiredoxin